MERRHWRVTKSLLLQQENHQIFFLFPYPVLWLQNTPSRFLLPSWRTCIGNLGSKLHNYQQTGSYFRQSLAYLVQLRCERFLPWRESQSLLCNNLRSWYLLHMNRPLEDDKESKLKFLWSHDNSCLIERANKAKFNQRDKRTDKNEYILSFSNKKGELMTSVSKWW